MAQKILIIDDDLFIRELYDEVLKKGGYEVDLAENGEEGLNRLKNGGYDLTLLDMNMEPLSGLQVLEKLSESDTEVKNGPILLLTNMDLESDIKEGLQKGAMGYVTKVDLTPGQLLERIEKILTEYPQN